MPDAVTLTAASSSTTARRTVTSNWRARRSVSRIRYGKQTVKVIRLDDGRAGFGRRRSPALGHSQTIGQGRKSGHQELHTTGVLGTPVSASDLVSKKMKERLELRRKYVNWFRVADVSQYQPVLAPLRRYLRPVNGCLWMGIRRFWPPLSFSPCPASKKGIWLASRVRLANLGFV